MNWSDVERKEMLSEDDHSVKTPYGVLFIISSWGILLVFSVYEYSLGEQGKSFE